MLLLLLVLLSNGTLSALQITRCNVVYTIPLPTDTEFTVQRRIDWECPIAWVTTVLLHKSGSCKIYTELYESERYGKGTLICNESAYQVETPEAYEKLHALFSKVKKYFFGEEVMHYRTSSLWDPSCQWDFNEPESICPHARREIVVRADNERE
jgi:hypothetical protein